MHPLVALLQWMDLIVYLILRIPGVLLGWWRQLLTDLIAWLIVLCAETLPQKVADLLPQEFIDLINHDMSALLFEAMDLCLWFYPLATVIQLYITTYYIVIAVRLVRWCLGLVPLIEG